MFLKALIIDQPWISMILAGSKTWEMRSRSTGIRGDIAFIAKGSGMVVAMARLVDSLAPLTPGTMPLHFDKHRVPQERVLTPGFKWLTPWVLANVRPLLQPVPYAHPSGAVIWVDLDEEVAGEVIAQAGKRGSQAAVTKPPLARVAAPVSTSGGPEQGIRIPLSAGNIRNGHFYLRTVQHLLPRDAIGGPNKGSAGRPIEVTFVPGSTIESDIAGDKMILRNRGSVRGFLNATGAREGDEVLFRHLGDRRFTVRLASRADTSQASEGGGVT